MISGLFKIPQDNKRRKKRNKGPSRLPDLELGDVRSSDVVDNKTPSTKKPADTSLDRWKSGSDSTLGKDETVVSVAVPSVLFDLELFRRLDGEREWQYTDKTESEKEKSNAIYTQKETEIETEIEPIL
ncbi:hypothetical protein N7495_009633 [Penicillium taxi]|uniref:uncharacterized protein n=1 Tax=Penicillium taxi TaxID=168475 RepID=UPI0025451B06|nr:uncharacterized protein N7495_009633 [Penicillium taxi]KAJ5885123.1 hypothetical protein N7495_009633 [Penicillium taxi]